MQIHKAFVLLGLAAILVWGTAAQDEGIKIGVVDIDQAISSTDRGQGGPRGVRAQAARGRGARCSR